MKPNGREVEERGAPSGTPRRVSYANGFLFAMTPREAAATTLLDRIIADPHSVDDKLFAELRQHFSEEEIIELIFASRLFTWAGTLNNALRVETGADSPYGSKLAYAS